jgi:phosphoglycolate phosphatase
MTTNNSAVAHAPNGNARFSRRSTSGLHGLLAARSEAQAIVKIAMPRGLVLFDIDGTLVRRAGPHHRQALEKAIRQITGLETTTDGIPVQGMLDRDIVTLMLRRAGVSDASVRRCMPAIVTKAQRIYERSCPDLRAKVCPGARMLLYRLHRRGVVSGLVTGNLTAIGWKKMERAGLRRYLRFGAFAELARDRAGLVRIAVRQARREGWINQKSPIALIGDHPNDIRAARANGVRSIAVATGLAGADELAAHSPDLLVPDMRALTVESLLGS